MAVAASTALRCCRLAQASLFPPSMAFLLQPPLGKPPSPQQRRTIALEAHDILPTRRGPSFFHRGLTPHHTPKRIPTLPPPCPAPPQNPLTLLTTKIISRLDPTGIRRRQFSRTNRDAIRVGDILQVRFKHHEPFAGVLINFRRQGVDTAILLRNQLTRVGVEMWVKVYSPLVVGIDVIQKGAKRPRRARLMYMRKPEHDMGSVQGLVTQYMRQRALLRSGVGGAGRQGQSGAGAGGFGGKKPTGVGAAAGGKGGAGQAAGGKKK